MAGALAQRVMFDLGHNLYAQARVAGLAGPRAAPQVWHAPPVVDFDAHIEVAVSRAVRQTVTRAAALFVSFAAFALLGLAAGWMLPSLLEPSTARSARVEEAVPNAAQVQPLFVVTANDGPRAAGAAGPKQPAHTKPAVIDNILEDAL